MAKARKGFVTEYAALEKKIGALTMPDILKDRSYRVLYQQYAKKRLVEENINFLLAAGKKDNKVYEEFIQAGAPQEINIDASLRKLFDDAYGRNEIGKAPWPKVVKAIIHLCTINDLGQAGKFPNFVLGK